MGFIDIATPLIELGIPVFPLLPKTKVPPSGFRFLTEATTDPEKLAEWHAADPDYNVALLANGDFCFLEFDIAKGMKLAAEEMGEANPETRTQVSGKGFGHYIFRHTERSRGVGNRSVNLPEGCCCDKQDNRTCTIAACDLTIPHHHHEWFSFRAMNKYLVGAGSLHPSGRYYKIHRDVEPIPVPDWVCDFVEQHSQPVRVAKCRDAAPVSDEFEFDAFVEHYGISIMGEKDDVWQVVDECPGVGYRHENSTLTAFYFDGNTLGWSCFAQGCPTHGMSVGQLIRFLNQNHEPYRGVIWEQENELSGVDWIGDDDAIEVEEEVTEAMQQVNVAAARHGDYIEDVGDYTADVEEVTTALRDSGEIPRTEEDLLPPPEAVALVDPENHEGLDFPGECAMYGKLAEVAKSFPRLPLGWVYPSVLATASTLDIEDANDNVRSNLYVALLGDVGTGKTACMEAATASIFIPAREQAVIEDAPGSHSGLANQLSEDEPLPRLLYIDELKQVMNACAIQGSSLPQMLCTLWNKDKTGTSVKKNRQIVYAKLSMLGGLAVKDPSDFARLFGAGTVSGLADRFLFGYSSERVKFRPTPTTVAMLEPKPVSIPSWVWDAKDEWQGEIVERRRMTEQALRIALVTAACNGETEITKPCFEAALRFVEWQLRLRDIYKPGLAETPEAEACEAIYTALKERYDKQKKERIVAKGASLLTIEMEQEDRWRLLNFVAICNSKSYYRRYSGLIDRVRKMMVDNGIISEVCETEEDDSGKVKRSTRRSGFVILQARLK